MSRRGGNSARRERKARYLWESAPQSVADKLRLMHIAHFITETFWGREADPPPDWMPEQVAQCRALLSDPAERSGIYTWMVDGAIALERAFAAQDSEGDVS